MTSESAKRAWHTRRVNKLYKETTDAIINNERYTELLDKSSDTMKNLAKRSIDITSGMSKYNAIINNINKSPNVMEGLPIESVTDLMEFEKHGRPLKGRFKDVAEAHKIRREVMKIQEEGSKVAAQGKIFQIEILQALCEGLIEASENKE